MSANHSGPWVAPTTTLPCPTWCALLPAHGFEQFTPLDDRVRFHSRAFGEIAIAEGLLSGEPAVVSLTALESAASDAGPVLVEALRVGIRGYSGEGMTGPQARQMAAALLNAADLLDETAGAS